MGKRRIRLIRKYDPTITIIGVDTNAQRRKVCETEHGIRTYENLEVSLEENRIDCAFICTSPLSHSGLTTSCLENSIHVFTELNLVSNGYNRNIALAKEHGLVLFLSSTFLYREEIKAIDELVRGAGCLLNYSYHVGQYLPDWHPWESYKDFFVGAKETNGCREIFAIELPWLTNTFGNIREIHTVKNKMSGLDVDYDDNYLLTVQHDTGHKGVLCVDVVSRKPVRMLEVYGENLYLQWDGTPNGLKLFDFDIKKEKTIRMYDEIDQLRDYSQYIVENAYMNEVVAFFDAVKGKSEPSYSFEKDKEILRIIDEIEG
jgi:predicted dehydrogenase